MEQQGVLVGMATSKVPAFLTWTLPAEGQTMAEWQAGRCGMCGMGGCGVVLDHCHATGVQRGYLCRSCNFKESRSDAAKWEVWRRGTNPATLMGEDEPYIDPTTGEPPRLNPNRYAPGPRIGPPEAAAILEAAFRRPREGVA